MALRHVSRCWIASGFFLVPVLADFSSPGRLCAGDAVAGAASTPGLVADAERSRHFDAVARHLELGGTMFGYVDVEGDMLRLGGLATGIMESVASEIGGFVREIQPVAGESYQKLVIKPGKPLRVRTSDGRRVEFSP